MINHCPHPFSVINEGSMARDKGVGLHNKDGMIQLLDYGIHWYHTIS